MKQGFDRIKVNEDVREGINKPGLRGELRVHFETTKLRQSILDNYIIKTT